MIEQLPSLAPDPARNARTIARCHAKLDRRRVTAVARYTIERNALLSFGGFYLLSLAVDVIGTLMVR